MTEAPVNGGRNYNGPKVRLSLALVKLNHMRETPPTAVRYSLREWSSKNPTDMGTIRREGSQWLIIGRTLRDFTFGPGL